MTGNRGDQCALAYPATRTSVKHTWINYTGCDSLYSAAADTHTVYFGGHERYSMNPTCGGQHGHAGICFLPYG